jgi:hypothetical protein
VSAGAGLLLILSYSAIPDMALRPLELKYPPTADLASSPEAKVEKRYSPAKFIASRKEAMTGNPDPKNISTSYAERQNLTMRMSMRWFTRLTNGFSKKVETLAQAVSLYFMYYDFARIHQTLRVTPAMQAGVSDHVWSLEEIAGLID